MFKLRCEESETGERVKFTSRVYSLKTDEAGGAHAV